MAVKIKKLKWRDIHCGKYFANCPMWGGLRIERVHTRGWLCQFCSEPRLIVIQGYKTAEHCMAAIEKMRRKVILKCVKDSTND